MVAKTSKFLLILTFLLIFISLSVINGAEPKKINPKGSISLRPAYLDVILEKSDEEEIIELFFANNSDKPISLNIYAVDFKQKDLTGIVTFLGEDTKNFSYSLASFLSFETNRLDIEPNKEKKLKVFVKNRDDVSPGGHYAAVVASLIQPESDVERSYVSPSVSSLIYLQKKGGDNFKITLKSVDFPPNPVVFGYPKQIQLLFSNDGNVHLIPYGTVEIKDSFGRLLYKGTINDKSARIFPESRRYITTEIRQIEKSFPISWNTIIVKGRDFWDKTSYISKESFLYIHPLALVAFTLTIIVYIFFKYFRRSKKK